MEGRSKEPKRSACSHLHESTVAHSLGQFHPEALNQQTPVCHTHTSTFVRVFIHSGRCGPHVAKPSAHPQPLLSSLCIRTV